ncbi:glutathione S-transferase family protein [Thalassobius sp. MITS945101]|uniref:glutathione S-transferase family protein n=1 Tax=Thalassobius sp. MITS945101 TaxID=3096994 RepID=UPI00399A717E
MLEIWGRRTSSNVQALMWCVGELGLDYTRHEIGHIYGGTDTDEFHALNPNRTVPVLKDGDGPALWETGAMLRYLASRYAPEPFWPTDPIRRAEVDVWAEWAKLNVAGGFTGPVFWRVVRTPEAQRDPTTITTALTALNARLQIAENRLQDREWLCGPAFSLSDIQFGQI